MIIIKIGIIDADLLDKGTRHPNLALAKLSGYHKANGNKVTLLTDYLTIEEYDIVYLSCVFSFTKIPIDIKAYPNLMADGTGLYWDKAGHLPYEIEHHMPDYHLYDKYIESEIERGIKPVYFKDYKDYSIGFATRGCVRQCSFCINHKSTSVQKHSPIAEFHDPSNKYIYLWDDNFLAYKNWSEILDELIATKRPFQFRQGLDMRFMTEEKAKKLAECKYHGDYIFAFDNIEDTDLISKKLKLWKEYIPTSKNTKLYVFCGYDRNDKWDKAFWDQDIIDTFERIKILMKHGCVPYIMRYDRYEESSTHRGTYISLARWCNQLSMFKKKSYRQWCAMIGAGESAKRYLRQYEEYAPCVATKYFDLRFEDLNTYK